MEGIEKFRRLRVWAKAHSLVLAVYGITGTFPKTETYSLVSQMNRSAVSVVANIVESTKRSTNKDKRHFFVMSDASLEELKYYFILSYHLNYISEEQATSLTHTSRDVGRMLSGLIKRHS